MPPLSAGRRVLLLAGGTEQAIDIEQAVAAGYTIVDLSDDWTPYIFAEHQAPDGRVLPNRYRRVFIGLANDKLDEDGEPLPAGSQNYLELYGIPPSLSVLRARFIEDGERSCDAPAPAQPPATKKAGDAAILAAAEHRLACEGLLGKDSRHKRGTMDDGLRQAIKRFQQKHMIYEGHGLQLRTREALGRPLVDNDHRAFARVLRERVVSAAGVVEDGSVEGTKSGAPTYVTVAGDRQAVRNLADELTDAALKQMGLTTPADTLAFFKRHPPSDFTRMRVAVKLPLLPEYYGPMMDIQFVIDRGDIWYDLPFDDKGTYAPQGRKKYPQFVLYVKHRGQRIPLARWRSTIGGWRAEQASDGYEYFRYKGSDVGPRVIRNVVAGPVWIAPASTPIRGLVKVKRVRNKREPVVNYDELGPGYLSAYGLVAGYLVTPGQAGRPDFDNGIRIHGSSEYLSMYSANGYSHGCHRLPNHLAIRLYSFVLKHRTVRLIGDQPADFARQFLKGDDAFEIRIPSRGYAFYLDPPLPVEVLEGDIKGAVKSPILTYVPKPGTRYPGPPPAAPNSPEARAGGVPDPVDTKKGAATPNEPEEKP